MIGHKRCLNTILFDRSVSIQVGGSCRISVTVVLVLIVVERHTVVTIIKFIIINTPDQVPRDFYNYYNYYK